MALYVNTFSIPMVSDYQSISNMDSNDKPKGWGVPVDDSYGTKFANNYNAYALEGVVPGATNVGGDKSILVSYFDSFSNATTVHDFAVALASFWSTVCLVPGPVAFGGIAPISSVNDAMGKVPLFEQAIRISLTDVLDEPYYHTFINNIENIAVKSIIWTITEDFGPAGPKTFPSSIT